MATNVTLINCDNKPVSVLANSFGEGSVGQVNLLTPEAFIDFTSPTQSYNAIMKETGFLDALPRENAIDKYGIKETAEALATAYSTLLNNTKKNLFDKVVSETQLADPDAILSAVYDEDVERLDLEQNFQDVNAIANNLKTILESILFSLNALSKGIEGDDYYGNLLANINELIQITKSLISKCDNIIALAEANKLASDSYNLDGSNSQTGLNSTSTGNVGGNMTGTGAISVGMIGDISGTITGTLSGGLVQGTIAATGPAGSMSGSFSGNLTSGVINGTMTGTGPLGNISSIIQGTVTKNGAITANVSGDVNGTITSFVYVDQNSVTVNNTGDKVFVKGTVDNNTLNLITEQQRIQTSIEDLLSRIQALENALTLALAENKALRDELLKNINTSGNQTLTIDITINGGSQSVTIIEIDQIILRQEFYIDNTDTAKTQLSAADADSRALENRIKNLEEEIDRIQRVVENQNERIDRNTSAIRRLEEDNRYFRQQFPYLNDRMDTGVISPTELAEYAKEYAYNSMLDLINDILQKPAQFLKNLNNFFSGNFAGKNTQALCGALSNPFAKLTGFINSALDAFSKIQGLLSLFSKIASGLKKLTEPGGLNKVLDSVKQAAMKKLDQMKNVIEDTIKNMVDSLKSKVDNVVNQFNSFTANINQFVQKGSLSSLQTMAQDRMAQVRNFFSEKNMENLIEKSKEAVGRFANQVSNLDLTNIAGAIGTILFMACQLTSRLQDFLNKPIEAMKGLVDRTQNEFNRTALFSQQALRESVLNGRPYIDPNQRAAEIQRFRNERRAAVLARTQNSETGGGQGGDYVPDNIVFSYTPERSSHPAPDGWSTLTFGGQVLNPVVSPSNSEKFWDWDQAVNMRDYGGGSIVPKDSGIDNAIGYYGIKLEVLERADALVKAMLEIGGDSMPGAPSSMRNGKMLITSGFRHEIYNQHLRNRGIGAALNSQHMQGKALDCIMGRGRFREAWIEMARKHGFGGIGRYNTFVHIDIGPVRGWNG